MTDRIVRADQRDLERLRRMLRKVTEDDADEVRRRLGARDEARVLDVACGECREAEVLTDFLSELRGSRDGTVKLTGIDVREREIADAARRFGERREANGGPAARECEFLSGDASRLDEEGAVGENFDLVFMRHQNFWNGARTWEAIYDQALAKLDEGGRLVITSYFDREHELAVEAIRRLGGDLVRSEFNPETRALPTPGKSVDRHVAVFRRRE